jgi:hypothetical protein
MNTLESDSVDLRIERWRKNLVDISPRNGLLDIRDGRAGCLKMAKPPAQEIVDHIVKDKASYELEQGRSDGEPTRTDPGHGRILPDAERGKVERALMVMRTKAREALREQGTNILFLTVGILEWSGEGTEGRRLRSPLIMIPVELRRDGPLEPYRLRSLGEDVAVNPTLAHKLALELKIALPALPPEGLDVAKYLAEVTALAHRLGWEVKDDVYLGLFKFPKMCMYDELGQARELVAAHPVIRAIAGEPLPPGGLAAERDNPAPGGTFQVLDADSSQQEAIALAVKGNSFVLQGPPGTGKSQTIANIISEMLARGRTVLFVSEKLAALEVVAKRLEARGLGDYCLELHRHDQGRQEVIEELSRCLNSPSPTDGVAGNEAELDRLGALLDSYVEAMHQPRDGSGLSFYEVLSELTRLRDVPDIMLTFPNLERMGRRELEALQPLVKDIERLGPSLAKRDVHPWSDCLVDSWKLGTQSEIVHRLSDLKSARARLEEVLGPLCQEMELPLPRDLAGTAQLVEQLRMILRSTCPLPAWLERDPAPLIDLVTEMRDSYLKFGLSMAWLRSRYKDDALSLDLLAMDRRFRFKYGRLRILSLHYRSDMRLLRSLSTIDRKIRFDEAREDVQELLKASQMIDHIHTLEAECIGFLGNQFAGESTNWERLIASLTWTRSYYQLYGKPVSDPLQKALCGGESLTAALKPRLDALAEASLRLETALSMVGQYFDLTGLMNGRALHEVAFDELTDWAQTHLDTAARFQEWADMGRVRKDAIQNGIEELLAIAVVSPPPDLWTAVQKRFYTLWHDLMVSKDRALRNFQREAHERAIADFAVLDRHRPDRAAHEAKDILDRRRQSLCEMHSPEQGSGLWVLRHEVSRKKRLRPLRELFSQAAEPLLVLKPCLLMSPLSVSTYLDPSKVRFDLVIFDEASQVRPEDAVGSIMRGEQVIVVGDSKQLPPTDFFREQSDDEDVPDLESVLDECASSMPHRMLRWHYRSRQESLIAFSNQRFYGGLLRTFPSAARDREGLGVSFVHVPEGRYDRSKSRKNVREAEKVVELVAEHLNRRNGESLGVVAFSEPQQMAIIEQLQKRLECEPQLSALVDEDSPNGFFVKNLENVQGDERDVMIFSVGYGRDEQGKFLQNFGPINRPGGERRLNVAITRARKHVKLVSSLLPEEIESSTPGVAALRDYMEYVMDKGTEKKASVPDGDLPALENDVAAALRARGYEVEARVGRSLSKVDLAIVDQERPGNYLLGILTDGPTYRAAGTARDRERLRIDMLTGLGWHVHRLWSQEWIKDRETELARIVAAVEKAKADIEARMREEAKAAQAKAEVVVPAQAAVVPPAVADRPAEYERVFLAEDQALTEEYRTSPQTALVKALAEVVKREGPVHTAVVRDRLKELTEEATGKKSNGIGKAVAAAVDELASNGTIRVDGEFLWPADMCEVTARRCVGSRRDVTQVCERELEALVLHLIPKNGEADLGAIVTGVTTMLGYKKTTPVLRTRIEAVVEALIKDEKLASEAGTPEHSDPDPAPRPASSGEMTP